MSNTNPVILSKTDLDKLKSAANTIKKYAKYIEDVNATNVMLEKNLEEAIKAGDVTYEQKTYLSYVKSSNDVYDKIFDKIRSECMIGCKGCDRQGDDRCPTKNKLVVLNMMRGVSHGNSYDWDAILDWACMGRWEWLKSHGYRSGDAPWNAPPESVLPPPERSGK